MARLHLCAALTLGTVFGCNLGGTSSHGNTTIGKGGGCNGGSSTGGGFGSSWGGSGGGWGSSDGGSGGGSGGDSQPPPSLVFHTDVHRIARGGSFRLATVATPPLEQWTITVDDPDLLQASPGDYDIEIDALAPGTTTLRARYGDRMASYELTVVAVAAIEVRLVQPELRPGPTTHLTAIADSADLVEISYLDDAGGVLAGSGAAELTGEGGVTPGDLGIGPFHAAFPTDGIRRDYAEVSFGTGGRLIADGDFGTVAIDVAVVTRPAQVGVTLGLLWGVVHVATIIGRTSAGELLAGMSAIWTVAPTEHFPWLPEDQPSPQVFLLPDAQFHGHVAITAQVGALAATAEFDVP